MKWRRHSRATPGLSESELADTWQLVSLLLDYPSPELLDRLPVLRQVAAGLPERVAEPLGRFLGVLEAVPLGELQADYVQTFDTRRRCALHLTYFTHGDTRRRGVALVEVKQAYRRAGVEFAAEELPDHLCVVLEFGAAHDISTAWKILNEHRAGLEVLRTTLQEEDSPWLAPVQALRATLPELEGDDAQALARLIQQGPPQEEVGLDQSPYAVDPRLNPRPAPVDLGPTIAVGGPR